MAHLALVGGLLTPVLVSSGANRPVALFAYLTLLAAGVGATATRRRWWDVVGVAGLGVGGLFFGWTVRWLAPDVMTARAGSAS